jgi:hypothetical protein
MLVPVSRELLEAQSTFNEGFAQRAELVFEVYSGLSWT